LQNIYPWQVLSHTKPSEAKTKQAFSSQLSGHSVNLEDKEGGEDDDSKEDNGKKSRHVSYPN